MNRSLLFVPGHDARKIQSATVKMPDKIIFDLEDAVPFNEKHRARQNLQDILELHEDLIVRVNSEIELLEHDVKFLKGANIIIVPKVRSASHLERLVDRIRETTNENIPIMPLIETPEAIENVVEISLSCNEIVGLIFGAEDYKTELGARTMASDANMSYARSKIVNTARCRDILAIDSPCLSFDSTTKMEEHYSNSSSFGFDGCLLIHPKQIRICNDAYSPNPEEIKWAQEVVDKMNTTNNATPGIFVVNGSIVGPPMQKKAKQLAALNINKV